MGRVSQHSRQITAASKKSKNARTPSPEVVLLPSLRMAELDEIWRVQSHFSPHFLLILLIYLSRALAILRKLVYYQFDVSVFMRLFPY